MFLFFSFSGDASSEVPVVLDQTNSDKTFEKSIVDFLLRFTVVFMVYMMLELFLDLF